MIAFRAIHIVSGVAWAGSAFLFAVFIEPAAAKLGPAAGPMMQELVNRRKVGEIITGIAGFTVLGGLFLYWHDWHAYGTFGAWIGSRFGVALTIGAVAALTAFFVGMFGIPPNIKRLANIGEQVEASGGPPSPEQMGAIKKIQETLRVISRIDIAFLTIAVVSMATARYW